jgi:hypothetical protein
MGDSFGQTYGRWEFRARTDHGRGLGSAILLWPDSEKLSDGEIDIAEVPAEQRDKAHFVLHSGGAATRSSAATCRATSRSGTRSPSTGCPTDHLVRRRPGAVHGHRQVAHPDTPMHLRSSSTRAR